MTTDGQFDATVLRQTSFGNVQVGHNFDARRNGKRQVTRRRHHLKQHTVGFNANPKFVFERFEVNVTGMVLDRQQQHHVQQFLHRSTVGQFGHIGKVDRAVQTQRL